MASARWWVGLKDFIVHQLTGELVTEVSNASGTGLLDLSTLTWNPEALELVGVDADRLPPVRATTDALPLTDSLAEEVGLPRGLPVVPPEHRAQFVNLTRGAEKPTGAEAQDNPRAASARLRAVERAEVRP